MATKASLPCASAGMNGAGGSGMIMAMADSSSGASSASAAKPAMTSGVGGRTSGPPVKDGQIVQPILEAGDDAEIAATAAHGPEQVGVVGLVGDEDVAGGGDDLDGEQRVDGEAVLAHEVADAAA